MDDNLARLKAELNLLDLASDLDVLPNVLGTEALLKMLCKLPPAEELGVSPSQMRDIYGKSDVWKALGLGGHPNPAIEGHFKTGQR